MTEKELTQEELEKATGGLQMQQAEEPGTGETQRSKLGRNDPPVFKDPAGKVGKGS